MSKILVEFFSTCPGWRGDEQRVVAVATGAKWKDRVDLRVYHLDRDPAPAREHEPIDGATVIVNRRYKITRISADSITRALEQAAEEREPA